MKTKILYINCFYNLFDKIDSGAGNRSTMFIKALSKIGDVDVISFSKEKFHSNIENCHIIHQQYIPLKWRVTKYNIVVRARGVLGLFLWPWNPKRYYQESLEREKVVDHIVNSKQYDYIACRYINEAVSCGLFRYSDRLILDVDDNPVAAAKRDRAEIADDWYHKWREKKEIEALGVMSKHVLKKVRCSFYSNILESPYSKSIYLPNITSQAKRPCMLGNSVPNVLLIVGWLNFAPNRYGAEYFVRNVFPLIRERIPDVELRIAGRCDDQEFLDQLNAVPGVNALGFVDDIVKEYENCGVIVVPVYQGAGTSVKFVEGLMMNRPIVSTSMGVRGYEQICKDGIHYLQAEDDTAFAENIIKVLTSATLAKSLAAKAKQVGTKYFSQEAFMTIVHDTIVCQ